MASCVKTTSLRVVAYVRKNAENLQKAEFGRCILTQLGLDLGDSNQAEHSVEGETGHIPVYVTLEDNKLIISSGTAADGLCPTVILQHPSLCPAWHLDEERRKKFHGATLESGVQVAVACLLTTRDNHILLTRRNATMRTFPGVWVPPGGHVELKESLEEAGLRELKEETGLDVTPTKIHTLALWESVFPPMLQQGSPVRHHVVVYQTVYVEEDWKSLLNELKLAPDEVDAAIWFSPAMVDLIINGKRSVLPPEIPAVVLQDNIQTTTQFPPEILLNKAPPEGATGLDRISWGTQFALGEWLRAQKMKSVL